MCEYPIQCGVAPMSQTRQLYQRLFLLPHNLLPSFRAMKGSFTDGWTTLEFSHSLALETIKGRRTLDPTFATLSTTGFSRFSPHTEWGN